MATRHRDKERPREVGRTGEPVLAGAALLVSDGPGGARFGVRVTPRSAHEGVGGVRDGALLIRLNAPPADGAANAALVRLLGRWLRVAPSTVTIVHGLRGRSKTVQVAGMSAGSLKLVISTLVPPAPGLEQEGFG
jgi:uncharacterized protein